MDDDDEPAPAIIADEPTTPTSSDHFIPSFDQQPSSLDQLPPFVPEQRVFCKDKGTLYEAVIRQSRYGIVAQRNKKLNTNVTGHSSQLQQQQQQPQWSYLVHFLGWNTRYDKWVKQEDILPDTEEHRSTLRRQQLLQQQQLQLTAAAADSNMLSSSASPMTTITMTAKSPAKRKASDLSTSAKKQRKEFSTAGGLTSTADYCELPFTLQTVLVEEWEHITRTNPFEQPPRSNGGSNGTTSSSSSSSFGWRPLRNVHHLPATLTIRQVLQHFIKLQSNVSVPPKQPQPVNRPEGSALSPEQEAEEEEQRQQQQQLLQQQHRHRVKDFVQDLLNLIEEALPVCLLYPQERPQWELLKTKESFSSVCDVYGAEYLLRLVVRLPILMPTVKKEVGQLITELVVMLQKNRNVCFKGSYREPQPEEWVESERSPDGMQLSPEHIHRIDDDSTSATATAPQKL